MNNTIKNKTISAIEIEAVDWLVKLDSDDGLTATEKTELSEWLGRSPAHVVELRSLVSAWQDNFLAELLLLSRTEKNDKSEHAVYRNRHFVIAISVVLIFLFSFFSINHSPTSIDSYHMYSTAIGEQKTFILEDGSVIELNTNTQVKVNYSDTTRQLFLIQGEAHFSVEKDKTRTFDVFVQGGKVQAVGTAFTVKAKIEGFKLLVTEGIVSILTPDVYSKQNNTSENEFRSIALLNAGEMVTVNIGGLSGSLTSSIKDNVKTLNSSDINALQAWRSGELEFTGQSLDMAIQEINRYSVAQIMIIDDNIKHLKIGGRFRASEMDEFLAALESNFHIKVDKRNFNRIELTSKSN